MKKILIVNFIVFFLLILFIEIIFGYWFKQNNFGIYMRSERNKNELVTAIHNDKEYNFSYKRNFYAFRGEEFDPSNVKIVFTGGSTANQRFTPAENTIVGILNKNFERRKLKFKIYNSATDGKTTRGYVNDFLYWFPKIPNFEPKFFIFYTGINDRRLGLKKHDLESNKYDFKFATKPIKQVRDYIKNNSVILEKFKKIENKYFPKLIDVYAVSTKELYKDFLYIDYETAKKNGVQIFAVFQNRHNLAVKRVEEGLVISKESTQEWQKKLASKGWLAPGWPKEYGGTGWSLTQRYIFDEECGEASTPRTIPFGVTMVGPVIIKYGTEDQKKKYLPKILSSDEWWCQGYSEPGSGSDLASLSTKATKEGDYYIINGTKTWTSLAHHADQMFALVRTRSDCKPQEGISFLLIDMKSDGISVNPIVTLDGGSEINMVYLENVKVPLKNIIHEENKGWTVAKYLLGHERVSIAEVARSKKALSKVKEIARLNLDSEKSLLENERFMDKIIKCDIKLQALEYAELKVISDAVKGKSPGAEASILKIRGSEIQQEITELTLEASGYHAYPYQIQASEKGSNEPVVGPGWGVSAAPKYFNMRKTTIYGGSNEIQKNILAKMVLGL